MTPKEFAERLPDTAFAFRGYNFTNIGRTAELMADPRYCEPVERYLRRAEAVFRGVLNRQVELVERVRRGEDTSLETYAEAVAIIVAVEMAQLEILEQRFQIDYQKGRLAFGYSLGEIGALIASGSLEFESALMIPLSLAEDCAALAHDVTLAVLFSRAKMIPYATVERLCVRISSEGRGVIGISAILSPNSFLLMGQGDSIERFRAMMGELPEKTYLRKNDHRWPPLHTPIVRQRSIPDRAATLMNSMVGGFTVPSPPVLSLVTGSASYNDYNAREMLHRWTDEPQRLWDVVTRTLVQDIRTIVHVGPQPNLIPATYTRLKDNVEAQTRGSIGMRALSVVASRPWLKSLLPEQTALLRAPMVRQVTLEDWLLEQH